MKWVLVWKKCIVCGNGRLGVSFFFGSLIVSALPSYLPHSIVFYDCIISFINIRIGSGLLFFYSLLCLVLLAWAWFSGLCYVSFSFSVCTLAVVLLLCVGCFLRGGGY